MWIVELDLGCWFAPWEGDPGRTLVRESAKKYKTENGAKRALEMAKKRFPFRNFSRARVVPNAEVRGCATEKGESDERTL